MSQAEGAKPGGGGMLAEVWVIVWWNGLNTGDSASSDIWELLQTTSSNYEIGVKQHITLQRQVSGITPGVPFYVQVRLSVPSGATVTMSNTRILVELVKR